jgi:hypothetical protein
LRVNLNEAPSTKTTTTKKNKQKNKQNKKSGLRIAWPWPRPWPTLLQLRNEKQKSKTSNEIYEYLKTFSKYRERKPGLLQNYNQQIAYNFNSQNLSLSLRGLEALINNSFNKIEPLIIKSFKIKTNEKKSKDAVPFTFQKEKEAKAQLANTTTTNINKNKTIYIKDLLNKQLLGLYQETNKNIPIHPLLQLRNEKQMIAKTHLTETETATTRVQREIPQDLLLRLQILQRINDVSVETVYNRNGNNRLIKYSYKLLFYFFKSMYCLISKPVFLFTPDKVVIQLLYFLNIPKFKIFKRYSIFRKKENRKKRAARKKQIQSLEKVKFNVHSVANKAGVHLVAKRLNQNEKISSSHTFFKKSEVRKRKYRKKRKIHWKVARTLIRLMKKRTKVKNILLNLNKYNLFRVFSLKFKLICEILNNKFKKPVELQLIRVHKPYLDSNILVNLLSVNIRNKKFKPKVKIAKLFQKRVVKNVSDIQNQSVNFKPSYLSGIHIRIGGRLMRESVIPRRTTRIFERGARSIGKVNYLDTSSITNRNRKGSYTLKISTGQNFF